MYVSPFDVRLSAENAASNDEIINVVQPDVSVYCSPEKLDDAEAVAAPEYWIVDPANQTVSVL